MTKQEYLERQLEFDFMKEEIKNNELSRLFGRTLINMHFLAPLTIGIFYGVDMLQNQANSLKVLNSYFDVGMGMITAGIYSLFLSIPQVYEINNKPL